MAREKKISVKHFYNNRIKVNQVSFLRVHEALYKLNPLYLRLRYDGGQAEIRSHYVKCYEYFLDSEYFVFTGSIVDGKYKFDDLKDPDPDLVEKAKNREVYLVESIIRSYAAKDINILKLKTSRIVEWHFRSLQEVCESYFGRVLLSDVSSKYSALANLVVDTASFSQLHQGLLSITENSKSGLSKILAEYEHIKNILENNSLDSLLVSDFKTRNTLSDYTGKNMSQIQERDLKLISAAIESEESFQNIIS